MINYQYAYFHTSFRISPENMDFSFRNRHILSKVENLTDLQLMRNLKTFWCVISSPLPRSLVERASKRTEHDAPEYFQIPLCLLKL